MPKIYTFSNTNIGICYASFVRGLFDETFGKTQWILLSLNNKQSGNKDSSREGFIEGMVTPTEWSGNIVNLYVNDNGLDFFILKKTKELFVCAALSSFSSILTSS